MTFNQLNIGDHFLITELEFCEPLIDSISEKIEPVSYHGLLWNCKTELDDMLLFCPGQIEVERLD